MNPAAPEIAIRTFAVESMVYRVEGLIQGHLEGFSWSEPDAAKRMKEMGFGLHPMSISCGSP